MIKIKPKKNHPWRKQKFGKARKGEQMPFTITLQDDDSCIGCPCGDKWHPGHIFCQRFGEVIPAEYDEQYNLTKAERLKICKEGE